MGRLGTIAIWAVWSSAATLVGCGDEKAEPRAQLVVVIDTDQPLVADLAAHPELSLDAAIDTVLVETLGSDGTVVDRLIASAPDPTSWPVSFGVAGPAGARVRLRVRSFRAEFVTATQDGSAPEPPGRLGVERAIDTRVPSSGVTTLLVRLTGDCIGIPSSFGADATTCIDATRPSAPASEAFEHADARSSRTSRVGSWARAREVPCQGVGSGPDVVCIPGGYSILGDDRLTGLVDGIFRRYEPTPARPVVVSPFFLDRTEVTVGRFRQLVNSGAYSGPLPDPSDPTSKYCTWHGTTDASTDALPLNCITHAAASAICQAFGGRLPTEAEWEHAARGRGLGRIYPWGDAAPECCTTSVQRFADPMIFGSCPGVGPAAAGSHRANADCPFGDESRDGVLDLGGNVNEHVADDATDFSDPCWSTPGILENPRCESTATEVSSIRGGSWDDAATWTAAVSRAGGAGAFSTSSVGVRCAYADSLP